MAIQIYNTMSRRKENFEPLNPPNVTIYNCGPTVYDRFHIGNARNFIFMDMVRRWLEYRGFTVRFVQNLTDIDDKIINRARAEELDFRAITGRYTAAYFEDAGRLGVRPADVHPKATEHIGDIVKLIQRLIDRGLAYEAGGSVYFSVKSFKPYGKLSGRKTEDLLEGARVEVSAEKRDAADFALWKAAKPGEPKWDSPWGPGRPGWHIECSAMAMVELGETIDIHAGGIDLSFPHHENEIAQSEGATGKPFARYWMHNGFLNIDSEKMSKSLGNFLRADQILERWPAAAVRHFLLSGHYRSPLDLSENAMEDSASAVKRIQDGIETAEKLLELVSGKTTDGETDETRELRERVETAMDDDFNTPRALAVLFDAVGLIHETRKQVEGDGEERLAAIGRLSALLAFVREFAEFFGLTASIGASTADKLVEPLMQLLIETRALARKRKAFDVADMIRDRLADIGISLEDHPQGTIWKRKE
ncbi:cysteine--tRNA ligase [bacterium]|nr:cysteine--tRNA ligase [bacterium]